MEDVYIYKRIHPPNRSDPTDSIEEYEKYSAINKMFLESVPLIILAFGVPGNYLSILVLYKRSMRDNLFSAYLISMCVFNIITLTIAMSRHLSVGIIGVEMMAYNPTSCRIVRWLTFTLMSVTSWHLVIITGCRVLYLVNSRTRQYAGCVHPYLVITACFTLCGLLELLITLQGVYYRNKRGSVIECYLDTKSIWVWIQFFTYALGPALFLIVFNGILIFLHHGEGSGLQTTKLTKQVRQQLVLLVTISSAQFIITVFPVAFFYGLLHHIFDLTTRSGEMKGQFAYNATVMLFYCNNATNFLIYCFFWTKFRQEFFSMITGETPNMSSETDVRNDACDRESKNEHELYFISGHKDILDDLENSGRKWSYGLAYTNSMSTNLNDTAMQGVHQQPVEQSQVEYSRKGSAAFTLNDFLHRNESKVRRGSNHPPNHNNRKNGEDGNNALPHHNNRLHSFRQSIAETFHLVPKGHSNSTVGSQNRSKIQSPGHSSQDVRGSLHTLQSAP